MKRSFRSFIIPICIVVLLCVVAIVPLLRNAYPNTHDGELHYYRVVAAHTAWKNGLPFTRYLPDPAFGYGYPFFNYRAPVSYYLVLAFHILGLPLSLAFNSVYILSIVGSGITAYLLARDLFGRWAGIVAAVSYAYAPYQLLDALLRGNLPESVALALFPLILWAFRRLALTGRRRWFFASVSTLATLYLTHNISSLLFTPLLISYLSVLWLIYRRRGQRAPGIHWIPMTSAVILALGLAAFFLAPALLEMDAVNLQKSHTTPSNDFHYHFTSWAKILAPPRPMDIALMNPPTRVNLGLAHAVLGGIGLLTGLIYCRGREQRAMLIFFACATVGMIWLSTPASLWLWERLPLISFVQFPWRFVGRAALPLTMLIGGIGCIIRYHTRASHALLSLLIVMLILCSLPDTYPPYGYRSFPDYPTIDDVLTYERQSGMVGLDAKGTYFPKHVKEHPKGSPLEAQYADKTSIRRFDGSVLPPGATLLDVDYGPNRARVVVETPTAFRARYLAFYFPGWQVTIDGYSTAITPTTPEGLIAFDVPAGRHTVSVRFGSTPLRTTFGVLSLASLLGLLLMLIYWPFDAHPHPHRTSQLAVNPYPLLVLVLLLLGLKLFVDRVETPFRHSGLRPDGSLRYVQTSLQIDFGQQLALLGYDIPFVQFYADRPLSLTLYWRALHRLDTNYGVTLRLVDEQGRLYGQKDTGHHTSSWPEDVYVRDQQELSIWPGTPPGAYTLEISVYDAETGRRLDVRNAAGAPIGTYHPIATVRVTHPTQPFNPAEIDIARRWQTNEEDEIPTLAKTNASSVRLLGFDPPPAQVDAGGRLPFTLYWQAATDPPDDYTAVISLAALDRERDVVAREFAPPGRASHPTSAWQAGDVVRHGHALLVPADTPEGSYGLYVDLQGTADQLVGRSAAETHVPLTHVPLTRVDVRAPERCFDPPTIQHPISPTVTFGDDASFTAALIGYDLDETVISPGQPFTVTLHWQARGTADTGYVVFVHLVRARNIVAQSDRVPAGGTRPTTGWLPGEFIADAHILSIPPETPEGEDEEYILLTGLYEPATDQRLVAFENERAIQVDHLALPTTIRIGE